LRVNLSAYSAVIASGAFSPGFCIALCISIFASPGPKIKILLLPWELLKIKRGAEIFTIAELPIPIFYTT